MLPEMGRKVAEGSGEKSGFALTCNLLSQYIKEKGSLADLGGLAMAPRGARPPTTMSLLPGADVPGYAGAGDGDGDGDGDVSARSTTRSMELFPQRSGFGLAAPAAEDASRSPEKSQLTIFYGGKVLVFDNFPAEKARDLMQLASKGSTTAAQNHHFAPPSSAGGVVAAAAAAASAQHPNGPSNGPAVNNPPPPQVPGSAQPPQPSNSFLPMARKASLHRFFEKRKDRISAKAPYQVVTVKAEESQQWLGLAPQTSKPSLTSECSR